MSKFYWIFGAISGAVYLGLDFAYNKGFVGHDKAAPIFISQITILVLSIVFANIAYKKVNGGISFGRSVFGGMMVGLVSAIVIISGMMILMSDKSYNQDAKEYNFTITYDAQPVEERTEDWVKELRAKIDERYSLGSIIEVTLLTYIGLGVVFGAFTGAFISKPQALGQ